MFFNVISVVSKTCVCLDILRMWIYFVVFLWILKNKLCVGAELSSWAEEATYTQHTANGVLLLPRENPFQCIESDVKVGFHENLLGR